MRRTAVEVGNPQFNDDLAGMASRISRFVMDRMVYVPDPNGFELVTAPDVLLSEILTRGKCYGDCDDHVLLLNTMLAAVGFQTYFIAVKQDPASSEFNHVITGVDLNGTTVDIDPCNKKGREVEYVDRYVVA